MHIPEWLPYRDDFFSSYCSLVENEYGRGCYQSSKHYFHWLYSANEYSRGFDDCLIGVVDGVEVVGCIHKMRLPWLIRGELSYVPTLHNLIIKPKYRTGAGLWLLKKALYGEDHGVVPGVRQPFSEVFRQMKCQPVPSKWFQLPLRYVRGGIALGLHKLTYGAFTQRRYFENRDATISGCRLTTSPSTDDLERVAATLNASSGRDHVMWDSRLVRWRFFDESGPRHAFIEMSDDPAAHAVVSLGPRSGLIVARIILISDAWITHGESGLRRICDLLGHTPAHAVLAMTVLEDFATLLTAGQFTRYKIHPDTYLFHKDRQFLQESILGSEVTDIGFESLICSNVNRE